MLVALYKRRIAVPFAFNRKINPLKPLDPSKPPPRCWTDVFDTHDYRKALFGSPSRDFVACREWERDELERVDKEEKKKRKKRKKAA